MADNSRSVTSVPLGYVDAIGWARTRTGRDYNNKKYEAEDTSERVEQPAPAHEDGAARGVAVCEVARCAVKER